MHLLAAGIVPIVKEICQHLEVIWIVMHRLLSWLKRLRGLTGRGSFSKEGKFRLEPDPNNT